MSVASCLVLSTSHLSQATACGFDRYPVLARGCSGFFVRVLDSDAEPNMDRIIPDDLMAVMQHARAQDVELLHFDADADCIDGLPTFNW